MTPEQKDAIVKAAQAVVETWGRADKWTPPLHQTANEEALVAAVRAAERPAWRFEDFSGTNPVLMHGEIGCFSIRYMSAPAVRTMDGLMHRIARLLNEDDAKGGK